MHFIIHDASSGRDIAPLLSEFPDAEVMPAVIDKARPARGCLLSHQACIRKAKEARSPWVHVIEDDCKLTAAWNRGEWDDLVEYLLMADAHILNGGVLRLAAPGELLNGELNTSAPEVEIEGPGGTARAVRGGQFWSTHFIVYKANAYDRLLSACWGQGVYATPIDLLPGALKLHTLVAVPFVATQHAGVSAVARAKVNYDKEFATHEAYLSRLGEFAHYDDYLSSLLGPIDHTPFCGARLEKERKKGVVVKHPIQVCVSGIVIDIPKGRVAVPKSIVRLLQDASVVD